MYDINVIHKIELDSKSFDRSLIDKSCVKIIQEIYKTLGEKNTSINTIDGFLDYCKDFCKKIPITCFQKKSDDSTDEATAEQLVDGQTAKRTDENGTERQK